MNGALRAVATNYGVRFGMEFSSGDRDRLPISLSFGAGPVDSALNALLRQRPMYAWKLSDGVYDIYPKGMAGSLLDVRIRRYSVTNLSIEQASRAVSDLPEVKAWLSGHGVLRRELQVNGDPTFSVPRVSLTLANVPLRTVLNRILQAGKGMEWVVVRYSDKTGSYIGFYFWP